MGGDPAQPARRGRPDTVTLVGGSAERGGEPPRRTPRGGPPPDGPALRPAARDPVPAGGRARLRGARRRDAAGGRRRRPPRPSCRSTTCSRRSRTTGVDFTDRGGFETAATPTTPRSSRRSSATRSARARAPTSSSAGTTARSSPTGPPPKALTVFRRLLERERGAYWTFCFFTGDRYLIGASPERHVSVHGGDVRMNPISGTFRIGQSGPDGLKSRLLDFLRGREGDLRALHGRRRGAEDDVRHLQRGRPGARPVPQADDAPRPHGVPPRRPHQPRRARGPARHDVRRHGHRQPGRERLPADQAVRVRGPRLLRRRARAARPRPRRRAHRRQPDRDPHRRRRPRRQRSRSPPAPRWSATPTRPTRSPRRTPRPAASCPRSAWSAAGVARPRASPT